MLIYKYFLPSVKWFSTFQSLKDTRAFFSLRFHHRNQNTT